MKKTLTVLPAINCPEQDFECVKKKVKLAEGFAEWVHLDIADGIFTFNRSWNEPARWAELGTNLLLEVHLMCEKLDEYLENWLGCHPKRLVVHIETLTPERAKVLSERAGRAGTSLMLAMGAEATIEDLEPYLGVTNQFQVFSQAHPGPSGQQFLPMVLPKITALRARVPDATIEIDGGVNIEVASRAKLAGADTIIAGSYIFGSPDPKKAYEELKKI